MSVKWNILATTEWISMFCVSGDVYVWNNMYYKLSGKQYDIVCIGEENIFKHFFTRDKHTF